MKYADAGSLTGQDVFPDEQINLIYQRTGSLDPQTNKISYGNWTWATNAGNKNTPGFEVVSGNDWANLGSEGHPQTGSWRFNAPNKQGYTTVTHAQDGNYNTEWKGQPTSTSFTNGTNTDYYWAYRNDFTVYYVPNSELSKTVTRTINITEPGKATQTVTQTATISRNSYLNNNDNGVVYSDWSTGNWSAQNVPTHEGYTMSATQTVNGVTTPLTLVNGQVPAETVTGTTQNTTINITWGAVATATLTGNGESTYNGQAITNGELNNGIHVTVTGPTASSGTYTLQNGDVEFSTDGTTWSTSMPINAGKYQVRLTTQGETGIKNQFGNNSIVWTSDGKSTITSNATYTINKLDSTATMANAQTGNYEMTYNGAAPSAIDPAKFQFTAIVNGQAPVNADSQPYTIVLNSDAIEGIIKQAVGNGQNDVSNVKFASDAISGSANYTITPLESSAELSNITDGNYTKVYNAETTNQIDASKLHITANLGGQNVDLDTTGITGSDYQWVDASGTALSSNPKNVGTYYIKLSDTAFARLQAQNPNFQLTSNDGLGVYTIKPTTANITFGGTNSRVYNGEGTTTAEINSNGQIKIHFTFPGSVSDASYTLKDRDYYLVDQDGAGYDGAQIINVGTYTIKLTQQGMQNVIDTIHQLSGSGDSGYNINVDSATQLGNLTSTFNIVPSQNTISVSGTQTETYNGLPINVVYNADGTNSVKVSIAQTSGNTTGAVASLADVALDSGDFAIVNDPAENAGSYQVKLTDAGLAKIQNAVGDNYSLSLADTTGTLVINKAKANAVFSGDPKYTYTGTPVSSDDYLGKYSIKLTEPNNPTYNLVAGDIEFNVNGHWTTQAPVKVGTYQVRLSQSGWNHIKAINSDNVEWSATASAGTGTYTIKQANVTTELSGNNSMTYNGSAVTTNDLYSQDSTIKVVINGTDITNLPQTFELKEGDYVWQTTDGQAPKDVGNYQIKLTATGINHIQKQINDALGEGNVALTTTADDAGTANFEIKQAVAENVQLYGNEQSPYDGHVVTFDPTNPEVKNNFGFHNVEGLTIPNFTSADFDWYDASGKNKINAPTNAGHYVLKLNDQGKQALADANKNYTFVDQNGKSTISGQITYVVTPAELVVKVTGKASKVYNNQNAKITQDQINQGDIKLVWGNSTTEPTDLGEFTLTPDDLEVVDASGQAAIHANYVDGQQTGDTYYVRLTADALAKIKQLSGAANYNISQATDTATYQIYAHKAELTLTGNQTTAYGTELPFNESKYTLDFTNWVNTNIPKPVITWQNGEMLINGQQPEDGYSYHTGDLYVEGYPDGGVPTNAGSYKVKISANLTKELQKIFPDYDFSGNVDSSTLNSNKTVNNDPVEASHEPASYVITPAEATITINGAQHVKYGESTAIAGDQYTASVTAPVSGNKTNVVTDVALTSDDLTTVPSNAGVGSYTIKLTPAGLAKIQAAIIGHGDVTKNYGWTQADNATANFFVEQMPVTIAVSGQSSVTYGTQDWLNAIKVNPSGYVLTITTENGAALSYHTVDGDLVFNQTPGNVGEYQVELSAQGLANIEEKLGTNYSYPQTAADVTAKGTFTVKQGEVTVTLNGSDGKTYNAVPTLSSGLNLDKYNVTYSATVYSADGKAQTLTLTANDLQIIGDATNVGTYQVKLSEIGQEKLKALTGNQSANYKWAFNTNADYVVKAATASAELSGSNQKTFDGTAVTTVEVNSNGQILVHFTFPGSTIQSTYALQNGDYTWSTADGNAPTNVGTYTISLNKQAILDHLQNALNTQAGLGDNDQSNVTISADDLSGQARFTINPQTLTDVTISAPDQSKTYDAQAADLDVNGITITANGIVANNPLVNPGISASDFTWYDGTGNKLESAPVDVGTYKARLNASTLAELQNANSNYQFSSVAGLIKYTINPAPATATISGSADRDYNAQTTSVSDVMNKIMWNTTGLVTNQDLNLTGLTANSYAWYSKDADGNYVAMTGNPVNAGTYYLRLTKDAIAQVKADNSNYNFTSVDGEFTYTINVVNGTATLRGSSSKTYDGQAATTAEVNSTNGDIIVNFAFPGSSAQSTYALQAGDYIWENKDGQEISAPTNAGTYYISLTANGLKKLQADNPNYAISESGQFTYVISPAEENVTISGSQESTSTSIDNANFTVHAPAGITVPTGMTYEFATGVPSESGVYVIKLTPESIAALEKTNPNYKLNISSDARFTLDATLSIEFEDTQDGNKQVGKTITKTGVANSTINDLKLVVPDNYELAPDQELPTSYTFGKTLNQNLYIKLVHKLNELNPTDPSTNPDPTNKNWFRENGLVKDVARTINYEGLSTAQLAQIPETQKAQTVEFTRTAKYDLVTGKIVVNSEGSWTAVDGKDIFAGFTPFAFAGYTAAPAKVEQVKVTGNDKNSQITVTYTANNQTGKISYVDSDGKEVGQTTISGKTGETVKVTPEAPTGWIIVAGQDIPETVVATPTGVPTVVVKVTHSTITVTPETPEKDIPTGPVPGDPSKNYEKMESLTASPTRTIVVTDPSGRTTKVTQTVNFTRTATFDEVTGEITYSDWTSSEPAEWSEYTAPEVAGYTATQMVKSQAVSAETKNETVSISYTANNQTGKISYVDSDGKEVGQTTISGKTGETVKVTPEAPTGWIIVAGQDIPKSVTATATGIPTVTVKVEHSTTIVTPETPEKDIPTGPVPGDPSKNYEKMESLTASPTRTIVVTDPSGRTTKVTQTVNFTRTATFDEVTGEITYSNWASSEPAEWSQYAAPEVAGYTATQMVKSQVVSAETADETIRISYTANTQTGKISYVDSNGKEVGQTALTGKTGQSVAVTPEAPTGWIIVAGQDIPKSVTATATGIPTVTVKVEHSTTIVTPETPEKDIPTGPVPGDPSKNYEKMESLTASPTRTIVVTDPSGRTTKVTQTVNFTRTATFDEVTGEITYSNWASSEPTEWSEYTAPEVAGYTATSSVSAKTVTAETADETVNISYTANNQTGKISYVDSQGNEVGQTALTGKTDQSVAVTPEAPSGWRIVSGQDIPKSVTATATGIPTVTVKVEHSTTIVTPETPEKDIPTGPVPGDPSKDYEKMESLTASPTRTIVVTDPSGRTANVTQTVNFTRMATFDEVTGEITYSDWISSEPTEWPEYTAPEVAGYTATSSVSAKPVTAETKNETVSISYTANNQTGKISYVDGDGKEVGQTTISGKTGETVNVTPQVPSGWKIVPGQDIPKTITIRENGIPTVTVKVEHSTIIVTPETPEKDIPTGPVPGDPSKDYEKMESLTATPTRTIVVTDPSGKTAKVTQTVNFTITATFDEVTGEVTYSDWQLEKSTSANHTAQWDSYTPQFITHYVPSIAEVPAEEVNANTADRQVTITYTPASESQVIRYVDQNDKEISTQIVSGKYGLDTTFTPKLPNNWQAANTIPTSIKIGENGGLTTIVVEAKTEKVQQAKTVTETIHYHTANDKQLFADKEMEVNFFRTGVKNLVTGEITWNNWNKDKESFNEVPSPKVSGYTASPAKVAAQTVTPNSEDLVFNVIYTKNSQTHPTIPENKPNKPQEEKVSKQETKTQDKLIHEYGYKKRADGRLVDHTGHVYPASSKVKENGAIYSEKGELLSVGSRRKHELPQTGLHDNSLIAAIGSLLAGISIFGLLGGRKKKDDDK